MKQLCHCRTLATYITWTCVKSMLSYASTPFQQAVTQLRAALFGVDGESQRWQKCVELTDSALGFATGALYVDRYFSDADQLRVKLSCCDLFTMLHFECVADELSLYLSVRLTRMFNLV